MAGERGIFRGYALQAIDGKGRVALPAAMRAVVDRNAGERFLLLWDDPDRPCLRAADIGWSERLQARLDRDAERALDGGQDFDRDAAAARAQGRFDDVPFDASGRFVVPPFLKEEKGKLADFAFFWGAGDTVEIWAPQVLADWPSADPAARERCAWLMKDRGAA